MGLFIFLLLGFFAIIAEGAEESPLVTRAVRERWYEDRQWHRLVQYQKTLLGGYESPAESPKFFLDPSGKTNPEKELVATIKAFEANTLQITSRDGKFQDPVGCVFPARKLWIERKSGVSLPNPVCERYERFKEILEPQSLTYVFSSYYLNNPASAFGHTFLRINKAPSAKDGERYELADYGVGYAAVQVSNNPFVYSFLGVSGLMPGAFDINPYYYKVREYNDFESRDLWEYDLQFTPTEVQMVVAYIWELLDVSFNYHYFSENCSYRILSIFEVARPELELTSVQKSQVMPADTVQTLYQVPGLIGRIHYRPSVRATFETRYRTLNEVEKTRLRSFAMNESLVRLGEGLPEMEKRHSLDAAIDYIDYRYPKEVMRKQGKYFFKKEILEARAEMGGMSDVVQVAPPRLEAPHDAQGSRRLGVGYREFAEEKLALIELKLALHDLLDPKYGYPASAQITMGYLGISWENEKKQLALEKLILYEVISLAPVDDFTKGTSWRLKFSLERGYENECMGVCRWTELSGGSGATKTIWKNLDLSFWLRVTGQASSAFTGDTWRIGAGPGLSVRWNKDNFAAMAETYYRYDYRAASSEWRQHTLGVNWSLNKFWSLRANTEFTNSQSSSQIRALYYY